MFKIKNVNVFTIKIILVCIFIIGGILLLVNIKEKFTQNNTTCILLTTTVFINTNYKNEHNTPEARLKTYTDSINDWLENTDLTIYIVESSNYDFPEFKNNPRVKIYTFTSSNTIQCKYCSATPYEAESILRAYNHFGLHTYTNIIKVTGKYYIPDISTLIQNIPEDADIFLQNTNEHHLGKQNCEIFGCKTIYLKQIMNKIIENSSKNMNFESTLYTISDEYVIYTFPVINLSRPVKRSGDNKIMYQL